QVLVQLARTVVGAVAGGVLVVDHVIAKVSFQMADLAGDLGTALLELGQEGLEDRADADPLGGCRAGRDDLQLLGDLLDRVHLERFLRGGFLLSGFAFLLLAGHVHPPNVKYGASRKGVERAREYRRAQKLSTTKDFGSSSP